MNPTHIRALEIIAREMKEEREELGSPKRIYAILNEIVEAYADKCMHSSNRGFLRNDGVKEICKQLNKLQKTETFQDSYEVKYKSKKS